MEIKARLKVDYVFLFFCWTRVVQWGCYVFPCTQGHGPFRLFKKRIRVTETFVTEIQKCKVVHNFLTRLLLDSHKKC